MKVLIASAACMVAVLAACGGGNKLGPATAQFPSRADHVGWSNSRVSAAQVKGDALRLYSGALRASTPTSDPWGGAGQVAASDGLMTEAERRFPQYFPGHKTSAYALQYYYRYYPETGCYLGVDQTVNVAGIYVLGCSFGDAPVYVGQLLQWYTPAVTAPMVAAGDGHVLALGSDGSLWAWGDNGQGQLGDGTTQTRLIPVLVGNGFKAVAAGFWHSVALKTDGTLWAWGSNGNAQIGDGTTTNRTSPVMIDTGYTSIAAGGAQTFAIKSDGTLWAWGANDAGQLGDGSTTTRPRPVNVPGTYTSVATGFATTVAVKTDRTLWSWGSNEEGQLGDGTFVDRSSPVQVGSGYRAVAIGGGGGQYGVHVIALKDDGSMWAWGENSFGQVGDGTYTIKTAPTYIGSDFVSVSAGQYHSAAIKADGTIWTWGLGTSGQLGGELDSFFPTSLDIRAPRQVGSGYSTVALGNYFSVGLKTDGSVWTWGKNDRGQMGDGSTGPQLTPVQVGSGFSSVGANWDYSMARKPDGSVWAWGFLPLRTPTPTLLLSNSAAALAGSYRLFVQQIDGIWSSFGYDPPPVSEGAYSTVTGGNGFTVGLKADGTLWAWGYNNGGQVGDGTTTNRDSPVQIGSGFKAVTTTYDHSFAIKSDGSLWAWGSSRDNALGFPVSAPCYCALSPTLVGTDFASVSAGGDHTLAIKTDGSLWAWGQSYTGVFGDGSQTLSTIPKQVGTGYKAVSSTNDWTLAIKLDGSLWSWGSNSEGQLGDGTQNSRNTPYRIGDDFTDIATGVGHSVALKSDGSVWAWGRNTYGQIGNGKFDFRSVPGQVPGLALGGN